MDQRIRGGSERFVAGTLHCAGLAVVPMARPHRGTAVLVLARFDQPDALGRLGRDLRAERGVRHQQTADHQMPFTLNPEVKCPCEPSLSTEINPRRSRVHQHGVRRSVRLVRNIRVQLYVRADVDQTGELRALSR